MKNKILFIILLTLLSTGLFSEVRLLGYMESDVQEESKDDSFIDRIDGENPIYGIVWEVIFNNVGLGGHYGVNFDKIADYGISEDWLMDWKGDMFLSYHLFGEKTFIDPFAEIGIGNAGRVFIKVEEHEDDYGYNYNDDYDEYDCEHEQSDVTNMSMYSYASIGVAMNFSDIIIGAKVNYLNGVMEIPATSFENYPMENLTFTIFTGYSF